MLDAEPPVIFVTCDSANFDTVRKGFVSESALALFRILIRLLPRTEIWAHPSQNRQRMSRYCECVL